METEREETYDGLQFGEVKQQIAGYASFSLGRQRILNSRPVFARLALQRLLEQLDQAIGLTVHYGRLPMGGVSDVSEAVSRAMREATLTPEELLKIADQSAAVSQILRYMKEAEGEKSQIVELTATLEPHPEVARRILETISRSGEINDNASPKLRSLRRQIHSLQGEIARKLNLFISLHPSWLQDSIVAQRNDRSVVLIKNMYKNTARGLQYGQSASGQATYLEPEEVIPLNNDLQNAVQQQHQEELRILHELSLLVGSCGNSYLANLETLGLLDAIFAKAQWAREHDAVCGTISPDMDFCLEKARHPLIDPAKVVPNSYHIQAPVTTILITGPNTGGKTVSLKVIGLFTVLQLSGFPLPCESARIPIYDNVFYDIGDNQSIENDLSTFSAHILKLSQICRQATPRSLVILDELGSGTDPVEGQALAYAVLDYFRRKQIYTVATTHFAKLKAYARQYDDVLMASVEFDAKDLKPTYRYRENTIGQSNAFEIAARYGLDESIIEQARQFKQSQQQPQDAVMERLQQQLEAVRRQQEQLSEELAQAETARDQLEQQRRKLQQNEADILSEARRQARQIVRDTQQQSDEIIAELKQQKNYQVNQVAEIRHRINELAPQEDAQPKEPAGQPLALGDTVRITLTNQIGEIIALDKKSATVLCGATQIKVSPANLVKTRRPAAKKQPAGSPVVSRGHFNVELNLIGMRVEEAMPLVDKFLDDAILAKAPYVRIIHGVGTGALRSAVWERLKKNPYVKKYELADPAQGGSGATIVTFRE